MNTIMLEFKALGSKATRAVGLLAENAILQDLG
jgi:hypothetical protein